MSLHAVDDVTDALDVTRAFLAGLDRRAWARLALVVLFVGGPASGLGGVQSNVGGEGAPPAVAPEAVSDATLPAGVGVLVAAAVVVLVLVVLALAFVGSVMEFVLVESLRSREVTVRRYWSRRWRQGVRLFGFRVVLGLVVLASVAVVAVPVVVALLGLDPTPGVGLVGVGVVLLVLVPLLVAVAVLAGLVDGFTTVFVVPVMVGENCGVLAGWRRLLATGPGNWVEYLAYLVASVVLSLAGGLVVGLVVGLVALLFLVPFGLVAGAGAALFVFVLEPLGVAVVAVVALLFVVSVVAVSAVVQLPVVVYLRYYALLVLGDVAPDLDLIPDQRAAVRGPGGGETGGVATA